MAVVAHLATENIYLVQHEIIVLTKVISFLNTSNSAFSLLGFEPNLHAMKFHFFLCKIFIFFYFHVIQNVCVRHIEIINCLFDDKTQEFQTKIFFGSC